jgi:hypothetical protein
LGCGYLQERVRVETGLTIATIVSMGDEVAHEKRNKDTKENIHKHPVRTKTDNFLALYGEQTPKPI